LHAIVSTGTVLFITALLSVLLPRYAFKVNKFVFSLGNMAAAGVLLGAGLLHQLADAIQSNDLQTNDGYPWALLVCSMSFIAFLLMEEALHLVLHSDHEHSHGNDRGAAKGEADVALLGADDERSGHSHQDTVGQVDPTAEKLDHGHSHGHSQGRSSRRGSCITMNDGFERSPAPRQKPMLLNIRPDQDHNLGTIGINTAESDGRNTPETPLLINLDGGENQEDEEEDGHHHHHSHLEKHLHGSAVAAVALLVALAIHSILAGFEIGIVKTQPEVMSVFIALIAHKCFAGYALGSTLVSAAIPFRRQLLLAAVFALSTPTGILIGGVAADAFDDAGKTVAAIKAAVAGAFLYIGIVEVGMKELLVCRTDGATSKLGHSAKLMEVGKLMMFCLGFLAMAVLAAFV
jgi:zinc transporter ZupT